MAEPAADRPADGVRAAATASDTHRLVAWSVEMRRVHARLREALALARDADRTHGAGAPPDPAFADPLLVCWGMCTALSGHHAAEDRVLFPAVAAAHPALGDVLRSLASDHSMLEHLLLALRAATRERAPVAQLEQHLDGIEAVMETHFRYEERMLLPVLDALRLAGDVEDAYGPIAR